MRLTWAPGHARWLSLSPLLQIGLAITLFTGNATAQQAGDLASLVNAYRTAPQTCENTRLPPAGPLMSNAALASPQLPENDALVHALKAVGYQAASAYVIVITGPSSADAVMRETERRYCRALLDPKYTDIGVRRDGPRWRILLARRLLSPNLGDWRAAGREVLRLTNAARAVPRACGNQSFGRASPLAWNDKLAAAALAHSRDMAERNFFDHAGSDGSSSDERATRAGYVWQKIGENIASGQGSPEHVVASWLSSPVHCEAIMDPDFAEMGAAYAINPKSDTTIYWSQEFGTAR